jgi:NADH dehydrogenase, FAD-containing subunit
VIVGAGFGGLFAARFLRHPPVEVTLVDRTNHHLFQPLLYQVATGILSAGQIAPPTRDILKFQQNTTVELADVTAIDIAAKQVSAVRPDGGALTLPYDSLIVGAGVGQSYFGHDEFAEFAPSMKTLADALAQRERIFGAFEEAEVEDDDEARRAWLTFVVVGGGPTGVEISGADRGAVAPRAEGQLPAVRPGPGREVLLFEGGKDILATFGDKLSAKARRSSRRPASRSTPGRSSQRSTRRRRRERTRRNGHALSREDKDLGRRRLGVAAREDACRRDRRRARPRRPDQGATGLLATGPP